MKSRTLQELKFIKTQSNENKNYLQGRKDPASRFAHCFFRQRGYAVVSSSIGGELRLVCLTEKGGLGVSRMAEAKRFIQSTDSVTGLTECASPDDSLFVPMLLLGGDDPLANAYRPIDDGPIGGGPSGIVGPYLKTKWSQKGQPFNDLLPNDYAVGCVPLAVAQIMAYEESASSMVFNGVTCSWSEMKTVHTYPYRDSLGTPAGQEQVANFLYAMGNADNCNVTYGPSTSATATDARRAFLNNGYSNATIHYGVSFTNSLHSFVRNQLFSGHPVYCDGCHSVSSGHAWVIDGYFAGYYHINWGWLGDSDGYYSAGVFDTTQRNSISSYDPGTNNELHNYVFGFNVITY